MIMKRMVVARLLLTVPLFASSTVLAFQSNFPFTSRNKIKFRLSRIAAVDEGKLDSIPFDNQSLEYNDFLPQPGPNWEALEVVHACMKTLLEQREAGLEVCFNFSSDRCRAAQGGSLETFIQHASNPVFGYLVNCETYDIVSVGPIIAGTSTRGDMQTVLMDAYQEIPDDAGGLDPDLFRKRFLWTLVKERRPPRQGFWLIHECVYTKKIGELTV